MAEIIEYTASNGTQYRIEKHEKPNWPELPWHFHFQDKNGLWYGKSLGWQSNWYATPEDAIIKIEQDAFIETHTAYPAKIFTRPEYESACLAANIQPMTDEDCQRSSYAIKYGEFHIPEYTPEHIVLMALTTKRLAGILSETPPTPRTTRLVDYPDGRVLDCGCTVYNRIDVMSASLGTSCANHYDDMSG